MNDGETAQRSADSSAHVNSLFQQPWWLDAVSPNAWGAVEIEQGGKIVARMPYVHRRRFGLTLLSMPPATQTLGPWFEAMGGKPEAALSREHKLMGELIERLPPFDVFAQNFHASITNWLPFHWAGFEQTTRYTYVLSLDPPLAEIWKGFRDKTRNGIRKAEREGVRVGQSEDIEAFLRLSAMTYARQGIPMPISPDVVRRLFAAALRRSAGRLFLATGPDGRHHSGIVCVYDRNACYYLMQGGDPALQGSGANALCVWTAIQAAHGQSQVFDFEGSMTRNIEHFVRTFGPKQTPYFRVRRSRGTARVLLAALELWHAVIRR